jgi:hypothetical protein
MQIIISFTNTSITTKITGYTYTAFDEHTLTIPKHTVERIIKKAILWMFWTCLIGITTSPTANQPLNTAHHEANFKFFISSASFTKPHAYTSHH